MSSIKIVGQSPPYGDGVRYVCMDCGEFVGGMYHRCYPAIYHHDPYDPTCNINGDVMAECCKDCEHQVGLACDKPNCEIREKQRD